MKSSSIIYRAVLETLESRRLLSFGPVASYAGAPAVAMAAADLNGDGRSDLVTANAGGGVSVSLGNANGSLQPAQTFPTAGGTQSVAVGDFDNDGKRDLITTSAGDPFGSGGNVSVLLGNGNGTFEPAQNVALPGQFPPFYTDTTPRPQSPASLAVGDLNTDGKLDLAVTGVTAFKIFLGYGYYGNYYEYHYASYVNVLLGNGTGSFTPANSNLTLPGAQSVGLADLNGDQKLDLLLNHNTLDVQLGNGNGSFQAPIHSSFNAGYPTLRGDFDGDGKFDLMGIDNIGGGGLAVLKGQGDGTFQTGQSVNLQPVGPVVVGDVNGDGKLDIVGMSSQFHADGYDYYGNPINPATTHYGKVLMGYGDGSFTLPTVTTFGSYPGYSAYNGVVLGDLNGDSRPDFAASNAALGVSVALNAGDWEALPAAVRISDVTITEGNTGTIDAVFTVTAEHIGSENSTVNYATADSGATLGDDYQPASGTLTFGPGDGSKTITVRVNGDRIGEIDEDFFVMLTGAANADLVDGFGVGSIIDDEPRLSIDQASLAEPDSGTMQMTFTATLSAVSDHPVTVNYSADSDMAVSGKDFDHLTGTLTFAPGQTSATIAVIVRDDVFDEYDETFYVNLSGATNALVVNGQGLGIIIDDDEEPSIVVSDVSLNEAHSGGTSFVFTLSLSQVSEKDLSVWFYTTGGTAMTEEGDYTDFDDYVDFDPTRTTQTVTVRVSGDRRIEPSEMFFVNLDNPWNVTIADPQGVGIILDDDGTRRTWVGPASGGNWFTASNWSPSSVPGASHDVQFSGDISVNLDANATVRGLTLRDSASLTIAAAGNRVFRTMGLAIDGSSKLNLSDNNLIFDYSGAYSALGEWNGSSFGNGYTGITGLIASGRHDGAWDGGGIISSQADALANLTTLGIDESAHLFGLSGSQTASFAGQTVDATTVLIKYTYTGDANLDGQVNITDLGRLASNWQMNAPWTGGDFNYDGFIDIVDLGMLATNWQRSPLPGRAARTPLRLIDQLEQVQNQLNELI